MVQSRSRRIAKVFVDEWSHSWESLDHLGVEIQAIFFANDAGGSAIYYIYTDILRSRLQCYR